MRTAREDEEKASGFKRPGPEKSSAARQAGQTLGAGFRRLSGADMQRLEGMARAISDGFRNACARDAETRELTSDPEWLRQYGFYGRSEDDF